MKKELTVEQMLTQLDEAVTILSDNSTTLEDALNVYAEAAKQISALSKRLEAAQIQITEITNTITNEVQDAEVGI